MHASLIMHDLMPCPNHWKHLAQSLYAISGPTEAQNLRTGPKPEFSHILTQSICKITHFQVFADSATYAESKKTIEFSI